jgi:cytochrome c peroxidase
MSESALQGEALFFSDLTRCGSCHNGANLTDEKFHNVGLAGTGEDPDPGRAGVTGEPRDRGAFKTPTLRNIARTAAYMHAGQLQSLEEVVAWFDRGGCAPGQTPCLPPLGLSEADKQDLVAFLNCLTGELPTVRQDRLPP